jgi:hypothetical protein
MNDLISVEVVNQLLPQFGITKPSPLYDRRLRSDGFKLDDFLELLEESPFVISIDWRAWLKEELENISSALKVFDAELKFELNEEGEFGSVGAGELQADISYSPETNEGNFDVAMSKIAYVLQKRFEVRASVYNNDGDTNCYAILPKEYWQEIDSLAGSLMAELFKPFKS